MARTGQVAWNYGDDEIDIDVKFAFHKGCPPVMYTKNGDGHPGEPDEIEILDVTAKTDIAAIKDKIIQDLQNNDSFIESCLQEFCVEDQELNSMYHKIYEYNPRISTISKKLHANTTT